jgi:hypothetical protein
MRSFGRYLVTFHHPSGTREEISVWEEQGPEAAIEAAIDWTDYTERRSLRGIPVEASLVGTEPDKSDLNVATSIESLGHRAYDRNGDPISTRGHLQPQHVRRASVLLWKANSPNWDLLQTACVRLGWIR